LAGGLIATFRNPVVIQANDSKKANFDNEISGWDISFPVKFSCLFVIFVVIKKLYFLKAIIVIIERSC